MKNQRPLQTGMTLIELVLAVAISAIIMAALNNLVKLGLDAESNGRSSNELAYQGRFALERITDRARSLPSKVLEAPAANTTGDWFTSPSCGGATCVMYCLNTNKQLIETTTTDTTCAGTTVLANNVSAFSATLPTEMSAVDSWVAVINITLSDTNNTASYSSSIRLGGGSL